MMAASLRNTAVAAGRAILLSAGFAVLGACQRPSWPPTISIYNLHVMSPIIYNVFWGVAIVLGFQTSRRFIKSMRAQYFYWRPSILDFCLLLAWGVALYGTLPYCSGDRLSNPIIGLRN